MVTGRQKTAMSLAGILILIAAAPGCSVLRNEHSTMPVVAPVAEQTPARAHVVVELRTGQQKPEYLRAPLNDTMLVQTALKESGALNRFHSMNVTIVRKLADGHKVRLPVHFNPKKRRVTDATNFALHPDDVIEVVEDTSTLWDRMIDSALEPLGPVTRDYRRS